MTDARLNELGGRQAQRAWGRSAFCRTRSFLATRKVALKGLCSLTSGVISSTAEDVPLVEDSITPQLSATRSTRNLQRPLFPGDTSVSRLHSCICDGARCKMQAQEQSTLSGCAVGDCWGADATRSSPLPLLDVWVILLVRSSTSPMRRGHHLLGRASLPSSGKLPSPPSRCNAAASTQHSHPRRTRANVFSLRSGTRQDKSGSAPSPRPTTAARTASSSSTTSRTPTRSPTSSSGCKRLTGTRARASTSSSSATRAIWSARRSSSMESPRSLRTSWASRCWRRVRRTRRMSSRRS